MTEQNKNINSGSGYLYENKDKKGKQPDFKGKIVIEGKEYLASIWKAVDKNNEDYFNIKLTDPNNLPKPTSTQNTEYRNTEEHTPPASQPVQTQPVQNNVPDPDFGGDTFFDSMFKQ